MAVDHVGFFLKQDVLKITTVQEIMEGKFLKEKSNNAISFPGKPIQNRI